MEIQQNVFQYEKKLEIELRALMKFPVNFFFDALMKRKIIKSCQKW